MVKIKLKLVFFCFWFYLNKIVFSIKVWRRAYDIPPPQLDESSEYNPKNDNKYKVFKENK
jgi:hypothetical protein